MMSTVLALRLRWRVVFALAAIVALWALAASPASAHLYHWHALPDYNASWASVKLTTWKSPGTTSGQIYLENAYQNGPVYVQARPIFDASWRTDGYWKRATPNKYGSYSIYSWSDTTNMGYDGYQFRICKDVAFQPDSCGSATTVYPYR